MTDQRAYPWRSWLVLAQTGWEVAHILANPHTVVVAGAATTGAAAVDGVVVVVGGATATVEAVGAATSVRAVAAEDAHLVVAAVAGTHFTTYIIIQQGDESTPQGDWS